MMHFPPTVIRHTYHEQTHLQSDFPYIPKAYLQESLTLLNGLYAPTYVFLLDHENRYIEGKRRKQRVKLPYKRKAVPFRPSTKGKSRVSHDDEFSKERAWVVQEVMENDDEYEGGIECGCCFATFRFVRTVYDTISPPSFDHTPSFDSIGWSSVPKCIYSAPHA